MSAVLTPRSSTIAGKMVAITVRSSAPTKTASSAAPRVRRGPASATSTPATGTERTRSPRRRRASDRRLNRHLLAVVAQVEGPGRRVVAALGGRLLQPDAEQVVGLAVDPEIDGNRRAGHRVARDRADDRLVDLPRDVVGLAPGDLLVLLLRGILH